jgi:hypothetical protein
MNPVLEKKYLDGEQLYKVYWKEMGNARSFNKLQKWCLSHQIVNPKTLTVPTRMGLWKAMWRWAAKNREKAFAIYSKAETAVTPEEWDEMIVKYSRTSFQNATFKKEYDLR